MAEKWWWLFLLYKNYFYSVNRSKDINGFFQVFQIPLNAAETVPQFISRPVKFILVGATLIFN